MSALKRIALLSLLSIQVACGVQDDPTNDGRKAEQDKTTIEERATAQNDTIHQADARSAQIGEALAIEEGAEFALAAPKIWIRATPNPCQPNGTGGCRPVVLKWSAPGAVRVVIQETGRVLKRGARGQVRSPAIPAQGLTFVLLTPKNKIIAAVAVKPAVVVPPPTPAGAEPMSPDEVAVVNGINAQRAAAGLPALRIDPRLNLAAQIHARNMAAMNVLDHVLPGSSAPLLQDRLRQGGYPYLFAGENIAVGFTPANVVGGWMASPGHRANILSGDYADTGLAIRANAQGQLYFCSVFGRQ